MNGLLRILASLSLFLVINDARGQFGRPPPVRVPPPPPPVSRTTPVVPRTTPIAPLVIPQTRPGTSKQGAVTRPLNAQVVSGSGRASRLASAASTVGLAGLPQGHFLAASSLFARRADVNVRLDELLDELVVQPPPEPQRPLLQPNPPVAQQRNAPGSGGQSSLPNFDVWIGVFGVLAALGVLAVLLRSVASAPSLRGSRIRIVATPPGDAPDDIRRAWIGLELPLANGQTGPCRQPAQGILSGQDEGTRSGYAVDGRQAVALLAARAPEAAAWWREHAAHVTMHGYQLVFPAEACELVGRRAGEP